MDENKEPQRVSTWVSHEFNLGEMMATHVPRSTAVAMGWVTPTPEEKAVLDASRASYAEKQAVREKQIETLFEELNSKRDVITRSMLAVHSQDKYGNCDGCDQGCNCDRPPWPCSTILALAEEHCIDVPFEVY